LKVQKIEFGRGADEAGEDRVRLAAMMGLVVEQMRQRRGERLGEFFRCGDAAVADRAASRAARRAEKSSKRIWSRR
jgi:hypothetical protein